jgi:rhodanese-related sulfurtransferase
MSHDINDLLAEARSGLQRMSPEEARAAVERGDAVLVDIREEEQRLRDGRVPQAIEIDRNVLEWRGSPGSEWRDERISNPEQTVVVMCNEGYQSSLAAWNLQRVGLKKATDLNGGFQAWLAAGMPVTF